MFTLDDELRETLDHALKTLKELESRRPDVQKDNPFAPMSQRYDLCKWGLQQAIDNAAAIQ
jgi:hypothetical protein